jgi:hypothetical protein
MSDTLTLYSDCTHEFLQASLNHYKRCANSGLSDMDTIMTQESAFSNLFETMVHQRCSLMGWTEAQSKKFMLDFLSAAFELKSKGTTDLTKQ